MKYIKNPFRLFKILRDIKEATEEAGKDWEDSRLNDQRKQFIERIDQQDQGDDKDETDKEK